MMMYYHTKFGSKRVSSSEDTVETHILIIRALAVTLTLKIANQSFCMSHRLMMMHHNTKFGNKMLGSLEAIIWTNIVILTLPCDFDLERSNPIFSKDTLAHDDVSSGQVWLVKNQQFIRCVRKSHILII